MTAPATDPADVAVTPACPQCGEPLSSPQARFCEACGTEVTPEALPQKTHEASAAATDPTRRRCEECDGEIGADGYCNTCGTAAPEPADLEERGVAAAATHRGRRRARNQDATALAITAEGWPVLVVADGVSRSPNPDLAARHASDAAASVLETQPFTGQTDLAGAVVAAQQAASDTPSHGDPNWTDDGSHPACTLVIAVAADDAVHAVSVGDSRAYLLSRQAAGEWSATSLTSDHSSGHALTSWLGADGPADADFARHPAAAGDVILACSDGLWNYAPGDAAFGQLVSGILGDADLNVHVGAAEACEQLVDWAIEQGGADNVSVAIAPVAPVGPAGDLGEPDADINHDKADDEADEDLKEGDQ